MVVRSKKWIEECKENLQGSYIEYFDKTTIHGFKYLTEPRRPWPERVLWSIGILMSFVACAWLMYKTSSRWLETPVIVTMDESQRAVWQIPFPAVTVCPSAKSQTKYLNYSKLVTMYKENRLTKREINYLLALQMVCSFPVVEEDIGNLLDETATEVIEKLALPIQQVLYDASVQGNTVEFQPILTEEGVCFSSNMLHSKQFFREGTYHATQNKYLQYTNSSLNWDPVNGYWEITDDSYPRPALGLGRYSDLRLFLFTKTKELHSICDLMGSGFKVILHSPVDFPRFEHESVLVPVDSVYHVMLTPNEVRTDDQLRHLYSPQERQCFYPDERFLKYFKFYTQRNCELECLANQTLRQCNCVEFYMPRMPDTPVCGRKSKPCIENVKALMYKTDLVLSNRRKIKEGYSSMEHSISCECLQSCCYTWYKSSWSNAALNEEKSVAYFKGLADEESTNKSIVFIYYKDHLFFPIRRVEVFGNIDLLASLGGLMGLCMGISLLSVIEFFYWILVRPCCQRIKQSNPKLRSLRKSSTSEKASAPAQAAGQTKAQGAQ